MLATFARFFRCVYRRCLNANEQIISVYISRIKEKIFVRYGMIDLYE